MIILDQAHYERSWKSGFTQYRGFTSWKEVFGRGSEDGILITDRMPGIGQQRDLTMVEDHRVPILLKKLKEIDEESSNLGLRAFVWNIEEMI